MNDIHLEVGMKVYAIPYGNARLRKHEPFCAEGTVTKVGRKYAYINFGYYNAKWAIKKEDRENQDVWPGCAVADDNAYYRLFPSKEACEDFIAAMDDVYTISDFIQRWSYEALVDKLTPAGVRAIRGLLEYLPREDADPRFLNALTKAAENLTPYTQALSLVASLLREVLYPEEAEAYLRYLPTSMFPRANEVIADKEAMTAFVKMYWDVRRNHDSDSDAVGAGEAWSKEECLDYVLNNCPALDKYRTDHAAGKTAGGGAE